MSLFNKIANAFNNASKKRVYLYLNSLPASQLESYGYSREMLNEGLKAWPWREDDQISEAAKAAELIAEEQRCIEELETYTDSELHDLGLSRGLIKSSVRYGRPGIDNIADVKAA